MPASDIKAVLKVLAEGRSLTGAQMTAVFEAVERGEATAAQMGAFLMGLRIRGETPQELTAAASFLRARMLAVAAPDGAVDIVGTGGDGHNTYNVSTCAAFVAAGAGVPVAKHGNRSVSSLSGSSDVLGALGVRLDAGPETISRAIQEAGVGFMWAPAHHPAMKAWAGVRGELGVRTLFNLAGPISNPARVKRQVIGVYDRRWIVPVAETLKSLGSVHAWVVSGADGMDELSTTGLTHVAELKDGRIAEFDVSPDAAGVKAATLAELKGGNAQINAQALREVLEGKTGAYRDIVLINAGAALVVGGKASSLEHGVQLAAAAIDNGKAAAALERLKAITAASAA